MSYNEKENLKEVNYTEILEKMENIPVYEYNYCRNSVDNVDVCCLNDDWAEYFGGKLISMNINDEDGNLTFDKDGNSITVQVRQKSDCLKFEDCIGPLLAMVQGLRIENRAIKDRLFFLEN